MIIGKHLYDVIITAGFFLGFFVFLIATWGGRNLPYYDAGTECYLSAFQWCHWEIPDSSQSGCAVEDRYLKEGKLSWRCVVMENIRVSMKSDSFLNSVSFFLFFKFCCLFILIYWHSLPLPFTLLLPWRGWGSTVFFHFCFRLQVVFAHLCTCPDDIMLTELQYHQHHLTHRSPSENAQLLILGKVNSFPFFFKLLASWACLNCLGGGCLCLWTDLQVLCI